MGKYKNIINPFTGQLQKVFSGDLVTFQGNEIKIKVYSQDIEPTLGENESMAIWKDTNDSDRVYLIFKRGEGDQVSVELS